ncbi:MAG: TonB-dependent receptor [Caulobacter sp.]|nr:TonB-dependent receptor [Caulobacter sp.]
MVAAAGPAMGLASAAWAEASVDSVVVTARLPPAMGDAAFAVVRIDPAQLRASDRLDKALTATPGVQLFRRNSTAGANPTTQGLSLRGVAGSGAGRALVTLDGVPQNDPFGGWVIWTGLPPEILGGADIVRGSGAGPYGAGALTGVVALEERDGGPGDRVAEATFGEVGYKRAAAAGSIPLGAANLFLGASGETGGGWIPVRKGRGGADTALTDDDWSASSRLTVPVGRAVLAARLSAFEERRQSGLVGAASQARGQSASLTLAAQPSPDAYGWRLQAWYRHSNLENSSAAVAAGRTSTTPASRQYNTPADGYGVNAAVRRISEHTSLELGADVRAAKGESQELARYIGGAFTRDRVAGGETLVGGLYVEAARTDGPWLISGGARLDGWRSTDAKRIERDRATGAVTLNATTPDADGTVPTGRAAVRYALGGGLYLRSAAYAGFRPATLNELHRPFRVGNDVTEANPGLKPEKLYGIEGGTGGDGAWGGWSANLFYNQLQGAITNVTIGGPGTYPIAGVIPAGGVLRQRQNAGDIEAKGLEGQARVALGAAFDLRAAATYSVAKVDGGAAAPQLTGLRPAQTPRVSASAGVVWRPTAPLSLALDLRYESKRFDDDQNSRVLSPSLVADVRADWAVNDTATLYLAVDNLLDEAVETAQTADGVESFDLPRRARVGVSLRY